MTNETLPSWNLADLYLGKNDPQIEIDIAATSKLCSSFVQNYKGKLQGEHLYQAIRDYEAISDLFAKIGAYAFLQYAQDQSNAENSQFFQNTSERLNQISEAIIFFTLEVNQIEDSALDQLLLDSKLAVYKSWLKDLRVEKPYQLSEPEENILHQKYITSRQAWVKLYDENQADMRFDFDQQKVTIQEIFQLLSHAQRDVRENAALSIEKELKASAKTNCLIINTILKDKQINDKIRGYKAPISSMNLANFVEDEVIDNLITVVKNNYPNVSHHYYQLKARLLGLEKMEYWDRNAPISTVEEEYIPWSKAVEIVLAAYHQFSPEMAEIGKKFFDNNWVDAALRPGKYSGAFAHHAAAKIHPYILVNYQGKSRDVMTLAHELGHGIHMYLSAKQGELMCGTPLTLAETASIFGEQVTFELLLENAKDRDHKKAILAHKIDDTLNTIIRQIAFTDFELQIHDQRLQGELSLEKINQIWLESQKNSFGSAINVTENYQYYWSYISHFIHVPFYVYSYAFANCLVNSLYAQYKNGDQNFVNKYIDMLESGGTKHYDELLAMFSLDAKSKQFWQQGIDIVSGLITQLEAVVD